MELGSVLPGEGHVGEVMVGLFHDGGEHHLTDTILISNWRNECRPPERKAFHEAPIDV